MRPSCLSRRWDFQSSDIFSLCRQSSPPLLQQQLPLLRSLTTKWIQTHPGEKGLIQHRHSETPLTKDPLGLLCVWILSAERWSKTLTMQADEGVGGRLGKQNKYLVPTMGSFQWLCYQLCLSEKPRRGPAPCCCATAVNFERSAATSGEFCSLATALLTLSVRGLIWKRQHAVW